MSTVYSMHRRKLEIRNTDPLRRCYNGCLFSSEVVWTCWEEFDSNLTKEKAEDRLKFWTELNDYVVSQRGQSAKVEYKIVEDSHA